MICCNCIVNNSRSFHKGVIYLKERHFCTIYDCEFDKYLDGVIRDNKVFVLDNMANEIPAKTQVCEYVENGLVQFFTGNYDESGIEDGTSKWGYFYLNNGQVLVPPIYDYASPYFRKRAKVIKNNKCGLIDTLGNVDLIWDDCYSYDSNGLCAVKKDNLWGYINEDNNIIIDLQFDDVKKFWSKGYAPVKMKAVWEFIDINAKVKTSFQFQDVGNPSDNLKFDQFYPVKRNDRWGLMDNNLNIYFPKDNEQYVIYEDEKIYIQEGFIRV